MPTKNRIRVLLAENNTNAKLLTQRLYDADEVAMSYIVNDRALPTKRDLNAMTAALNCETKDLYDLNEIDLAGRRTIALTAELSDTLDPSGLTPAERKRLGFASHGHDGMERVYIWYPQGGKEALFDVIKQLDYPSVAEWFRDMARITFLKAAKLDGKTLHEAAKGESHE
ncbi:MAG: hypothetical protein WC455_22230 [Dehalococcoidia bacterium]|jgi:hypothetical protein